VIYIIPISAGVAGVEVNLKSNPDECTLDQGTATAELEVEAHSANGRRIIGVFGRESERLRSSVDAKISTTKRRQLML